MGVAGVPEVEPRPDDADDAHRGLRPAEGQLVEAAAEQGVPLGGGERRQRRARPRVEPVEGRGRLVGGDLVHRARAGHPAGHDDGPVDGAPVHVVGGGEHHEVAAGEQAGPVGPGEQRRVAAGGPHARQAGDAGADLGGQVVHLHVGDGLAVEEPVVGAGRAPGAGAGGQHHPRHRRDEQGDGQVGPPAPAGLGREPQPDECHPASPPERGPADNRAGPISARGSAPGPAPVRGRTRRSCRSPPASPGR